jgi:thiamine transport system permease protein
MPKRISPVLVLSLIPLLFLAAFYFYPLARILSVSFAQDPRTGQMTILAAMQEPFFWRVLWFTTWQATVSTMLTIVLGLPLAYVFSHYDFPGKSILRALTAIPFVMPTVVVAVAFTALLGGGGLMNRSLQSWFSFDQPPVELEQTVWIIILAHAFYNVSVIIRTVGGFWSNLNPHFAQAAEILGASRLRAYREVTLPLLMPSIVAASLLVFLFCFTSFGVVLILGGLRYATFEVEIYRQAVSLFNLRVAAFLSVVQLIITFSVMAVYTRLQARAAVPLQMQPQRRTAQRPANVRQRAVVVSGSIFMVVILMAPLLALIWQSITLGGQGLTSQYYQELSVNRRESAFFVNPLTAVRNSLAIAGVTVLWSLLLGTISAYMLAQPEKRIAAVFDPLFLLPLGTSAVTLGYGYIISMGPLRTSFWIVPVAHTLIAMPFVVRTILPTLRGMDPKLREAAHTLGASPARSWREVDLPILSRTLAVGTAFAFTISLGEFGATLLVSRPDLPTMPVVIYRALSQPGLLNYGQALAMSTILMASAALGLIAIERFRFRDIGEF